MLSILEYCMIMIFLIGLFKSEQECLIEECGQILEECNASEICGGALSQVYDVCDSVQQCIDFEFVKTELCGLNDECTHQIITVASCFIDNCYEESNSEQNIEDEAAKLVVDETNNDDDECFENECQIEMDLCFKNEGCNHVMTNADKYCGDNFQCLNEYYIEHVACNKYEGCTDLVLAATHCYFQKCNNNQCITKYCHEALTVCINNNECNQALKLAFSGKCEEINCLNTDNQLQIMCNNQTICAHHFDVLANCYYNNCYNEEIEEEHGDYKGYGETECIAESGYHAYFDEYGNCCAGLDRVDCLWNLDNSHCGWFYHQNEGYCYSWQGAETCAQFKQNAVMAAPLSCFFQGQDCFMDSCNAIIAECKNNEQCASALHEYIYDGINDYTLCANDEECIQIFGEIIDCLNTNCIATTKKKENCDDETFDSTEEPIIINMTTDYIEMEHENEDDINTETHEMKEEKVMMEKAATN